MVQSVSGLTGYRDELVTDKISLGGEGTTNGFRWLGSNVFAAYTNDVEAFRIDATGNVGIGLTPSASNKLDILSATPRALKLTTSQAGGTSAAGTLEIDTSSITSNLASSHAVLVSVNSGDALAVTNQGNVGIGTSAPSAKLDVQSSSVDAMRVKRTEAGGGVRLKLENGDGNDWTFFNDGAESLSFVYNSTEHMRIDSAGNVGIGVTNPISALGVQGNIVVGNTNPFISLSESAASGATPTFIQRNSTSGLMTIHNNGTGTNGEIQFVIGAGSNAMRIDSAGNVGIGVTNPDRKLRIGVASPATLVGNDDGVLVDDGTFQTSLSRTGSTYTYQGGLPSSALLYSSNDLSIIADGNNSGQIRLNTGGSASLAIASTGAIDAFGNSISTTFVPTAAAHLANKAYVDLVSGGGTYVDIAGDTMTGGLEINNGAGGNLTLSRDDTAVIDGENLGALIFQGNDTTGNAYLDLGYIICESDGTHAAGDNPTRFTFNTTPAGSSTPLERLRIASNGRVTVGTSSTGTNLMLAGLTGTSNDYLWNNTTGNYLELSIPGSVSNIITATHTGAVGIGTAAPTERLHVSKTSGNLISKFETLDTAECYFNVGNVLGSWNFGVTLTDSSTTDSFFIRDFTAGVTRLLIDPTGNVGIGTNTPTDKLHINVASGSAFLKVSSGTADNYVGYDSVGGNMTLQSESGTTFMTGAGLTERMRIDSAGRVAIGRSTGLTYPLSVHAPNGNNAYTHYTTDTTGTAFTDGFQIGVADGVLDAFLIQREAADIIFQTNTTERMRIGSTGNIEFTGLTNGTLNIAGGNAADGTKIQAFNNAGTGDGYLAIEGFTKEYVRIDSAGNVGIGTTAPEFPLDVSREDTSIAAFRSTGGASNNKRFEIRSGSDRIRLLSFTDTTDAAAPMSFDIGTTEAMRIDSAGSIGIGTTAPESKLHVFTGESGGAASHANAVATLENSTSGYLQFLNPAASEAGLLFGDEASGIVGRMLYHHPSNSIQLTTSGSEQVRIDSAGNVGIGVTIPSHKLHARSTNGSMLHLENTTTVDNNIKFTNSLGNWNIGTFSADAGVTDSFRLRDSTANADRIVVTADGSVGFGTNSPTGNVEISASANTVLTMTATNDTTPLIDFRSNAVDRLRISSSSVVGGDITMRSNQELRFGTNNTERMRITNAGNVGIGNPDPSAYNTGVTLAVGATTEANAGISIVTSNTGTARLRFSDTDSAFAGYALYSHTADSLELGVNGGLHTFLAGDGNLGIGTGSPTMANGDAGKVAHISHTVRACFRATQTTGGGDVELRAYGGGGSHLQNYGVGDLKLGTNSATAITINSSLNVGIGETTPASKLSIFSAAVADGGLTIQNGGGHNDITLIGNQGNTYARFYEVGTTDPGTFELLESGVASVKISAGTDSYFNGGNLGVGTSTPSTLIHVADLTSPIVRLENTDASLVADQLIGGYEFYKQDPSGAGVGVVGGLRMHSGDIIGSSTYLTLSTSDTVTNDVERMRIDSAGNVGIGIDPTNSSKLQIQQDGTNNQELIYLRNGLVNTDLTGTVDIRAVQGTLNGGRIRFGRETTSGNAFTAFWTADAGTESEAMRINSLGNVGIGTAAPSGQLHVANTIGDCNNFFESSSTGLSQLIFSDGAIAGKVSYRHATDAMEFSTSNSLAMTIDSAGNVGVGTTAPVANLDLQAGTTAGTDGPMVRLGTPLDAGSMTGAFVFSEGMSTTPNDVYGGMYYDGASNKTHFIGISTGEASLNASIEAAAKHMTITRDNGFVGVGSADPQRLFQVHESTAGQSSVIQLSNADTGTSAASGTLLTASNGSRDFTIHNQEIADILLTINNTERMRVTDAGNVGIGTSAPTSTSKMHILFTDAQNTPTSGTSYTENNALVLENNASIALYPNLSSRMYMRAGNTGVADGYIGLERIGANQGALIFGVGSGASTLEKMRITNAGNVGIGTSTPTDALNVDNGSLVVRSGTTNQSNTTNGLGLTYNITSGQANIEARSTGGNTSLVLGTSSAGVPAERMRIDSVGNVGIGTAAPTARLEVSAFLNGSGLGLFVNNSTRTTGEEVFRVGGTGTNPSLSVLSGGGTASGNVGIGTDSPAADLHVTNATASVTSRIQSLTGGAFMQFDSATGVSSLEYNVSTAGYLSFYDINASTERMRIDSAGNVLVGITSTTTAGHDAEVKVAQGGVITKTADVPNGGFVAIDVGNQFFGFASISSFNAGNAAIRTTTTRSIMLYLTELVDTVIATDNGPTGGSAFTVTSVTNGQLIVTNTSGATATLRVALNGAYA